MRNRDQWDYQDNDGGRRQNIDDDYDRGNYERSAYNRGGSYQGRAGQRGFDRGYGGRGSYGDDWRGDTSRGGGERRQGENAGYTNQGRGTGGWEESDFGWGYGRGTYGDDDRGYGGDWGRRNVGENWGAGYGRGFDGDWSQGRHGGGDWNEGRNGGGYRGRMQGDFGRGYEENFGRGNGGRDRGEYNTGMGGNWNQGMGQRGGTGMMRQGEHTGRGPRNYRRSDERITEDVNEQLTQHGDIDATEINVTSNNGEVTLTGTVDDRRQKRMAEDVAESVSGVHDVHNQLRVSREEKTTQGRVGEQHRQTQRNETRAGATA